MGPHRRPLKAVQATLSLVGRMDLHRKWGLAALVVGPLVRTMLVAITIVRQNDAEAGGGEVAPEDLPLLWRSPYFVSGNWEKALSAHADFRWMKVS